MYIHVYSHMYSMYTHIYTHSKTHIYISIRIFFPKEKLQILNLFGQKKKKIPEGGPHMVLGKQMASWDL